MRKGNGIKSYRKYFDDNEEGNESKSETPENSETIYAVKDSKTGRLQYLTADGKPLFTQDHMNVEIGKARQKAAEQNKTLISQLENLKSQSGNSEELQAELQAKIDQLQSIHLTEQQQYELEVKKLKDSLQKTTESLAGERDSWRDRYEFERIASEIAESASKHKAVSAEQMAALLSGKTKLAPIKGEDGKPTGSYETQVALKDTDKEGKQVTLILTVDKAIERMRQQPERYGNLFQHDQKSGLEGGNLLSRSAYSGSEPPKTIEEYEAFRKVNAGRLGIMDDNF